MLKEFIDKFYEESERADKERDYFYVSEAGKCPRAVFYSVKQAPKKPMEPRAIRVLAVGDYMHMRLVGVLASMGVLRSAEVDIAKQNLVHGRADAIVSINNELYVVDFKSINSNAFKYLNEPKSEHIKQVQLYMHFFQIPRAIILYECKDKSEILEFLVDYDKKICENLLKSLGVIMEQVKAGVIPAIPRDLESWQCEYCAYSDICRKHEAEGIRNWQ